MSEEKFTDGITYCYALHKGSWWRVQRAYPFNMWKRVDGEWKMSQRVDHIDE